MKTVILIPAHNAADTISGVVNQIRQRGFSVVVVDDGSTDATFQRAKEAGADVLQNEKNLGKGAALCNGFRYILSKDFDAVITMDADGQHDPASLKDFIQKAESSGSTFILGDRMHRASGMPWIRVLTNKLMSWVLSKKTGQYVSDTQCGYRLIKKDLLTRMELRTSRYEIESEMLIEAARLGAKIESVSVKSIYTGQSSHINPVIDTWRFIRLMMSFK